MTHALRSSLEEAGVIFLHDEELGEGVRLRSQSKAPAVTGRTRGRSRAMGGEG